MKYHTMILYVKIDYYSLTKSTKRIILYCKFSSYSITASLLSNLELVTFFDENETNLYRYNTNVVKL